MEIEDARWTECGDIGTSRKALRGFLKLLFRITAGELSQQSLARRSKRQCESRKRRDSNVIAAEIGLSQNPLVAAATAKEVMEGYQVHTKHRGTLHGFHYSKQEKRSKTTQEICDAEAYAKFARAGREWATEVFRAVEGAGDVTKTKVRAVKQKFKKLGKGPKKKNKKSTTKDEAKNDDKNDDKNEEAKNEEAKNDDRTSDKTKGGEDREEQRALLLHAIRCIDACGTGVWSRLKGFLERWGGNKLREEHRKTGAVAIADEYMTSQMCLLCSFPTVHPTVTKTDKHGSTRVTQDLGTSACYNKRYPLARFGFASQNRDVAAASKNTHSAPPTATPWHGGGQDTDFDGNGRFSER
ncbi:hypothetical protein GGI12_001733 [Dipsacomyces acuminosporus]|nr:hypothetical protein GGI12_001733 [Dipsacomyces acuminosporus]